MVALMNRRLALGTVGAGMIPFQTTNLSLLQATDLICKATPTRFRQAVRDSGNHFLYRGEGVTTISVLHPEPDLLVEGTYGKKSDALVYFQQLETTLIQRPARPSQGHIGTPKPQDAAAWGNVVSIWPLGTHIDFVWPRSASTFYPGCQQNELVIGTRLPEALQQGSEVLFASYFVDSDPCPHGVSLKWMSAYLAVPKHFDPVLMELLLQRNYMLAR